MTPRPSRTGSRRLRRAAAERHDAQIVRHELPEEVPELEWQRGDGAVHLPAVLARAFGISTSEARRLIAQGGVKLDGEPVDGGMLDVAEGSLDGKVLQLGKRRFVRLRLI